MPRKPLIIILIAACFLLSPAFILLQTSLVTLTPVIGPYNVFSLLSVHDWFLLLLYPVCAVSIFFVRKWGWYVYMFCSAYFFAANVAAYIIHPQYQILSLIAYNLVLTVTAGIFFRRAVIAPYFNPGVRWWEQPPRLPLGAYLFAGEGEEAVRADIVDISSSGVFAVCHGGAPRERTLTLTLCVLGHRLRVRAAAVRREPREAGTGIGFQFKDLGAVEKTALRSLLSDLRRAGFLDRARRVRGAEGKGRASAPRYRLSAAAAVIDAEGRRRPAVLLNLSRTGCLLAFPRGAEAGGKRFAVSLRCFGEELAVEGEPRWTCPAADGSVCGAVFVFSDRIQRRAVRRMLARSFKAGSRNLRRSALPLPAEKLEAAALGSPYRLVHALKKCLSKSPPHNPSAPSA